MSKYNCESPCTFSPCSNIRIETSVHYTCLFFKSLLSKPYLVHSIHNNTAWIPSRNVYYVPIALKPYCRIYFLHFLNSGEKMSALFSFRYYKYKYFIFEDVHTKTPIELLLFLLYCTSIPKLILIKASFLKVWKSQKWSAYLFVPYLPTPIGYSQCSFPDPLFLSCSSLCNGQNKMRFGR